MMHSGCNACGMIIGGAIVWMLLAAGLSMVAWNKVVVKVASFKTVKYWQALLMVFTIGFLFCLPRYATKSCCHGQGCPWSAKDSATKE